MSIFTNQEFLNKLVKLAQAANQPDPNDLINTAVKLVNNLKSQLETPTFTSERDNTSLYPKDLANLDSLLDFLNFNQIKFNNFPIVITHQKNNEYGDILFKSLNKEQQAQYVKYPDNDNFRYYVNKSALNAYLRDLQSKNNPLLNTRVKSLIDQANNELNLEMSSQPEEKLDPKEVVDKLPANFSPSNINTQGGGMTLTVADLDSFKDKSSFYKNILSKLPYFDKGQTITTENPLEYNKYIPQIVKALNHRAQSYYDSTEEPKFKKYLESVKNVARLWGINPTDQATTQSNQDAANSPEAISQLTTAFPLDFNIIVFDKVQKFAENYVKYFSNDQARYNHVAQAIVNLNQTYPAIRNQDLRRSFRDVSNDIYRTSNKEIKSPGPYLDLLDILLDGVDQMLGNMDTFYRPSEGNPRIAGILNKIQEQKTILASNKNIIHQWQQQLDNATANFLQKK